MTDTNGGTPTDDDEELIPVEDQPQDDTPQGDPVDDDDDDGDDGDARLGEDEDGNVDDPASSNRDRRRKRREAQRRAREAQEREIRELREEIARLKPLNERLDAIEGHSVQTTIANLEARIAKAIEDARQAEQIEAAALSQSNGEDAVLARKVRDAAEAEARKLLAARQQMVDGLQRRETPATPAQPVANPHMQEWLRQNEWFDPSGSDQYSSLVKGIDNEVARDGFDPNSREYWAELTKRATVAIQRLEGTTEETKPRRNGPPIGGGGREHAPTATRSNEIFVTPERKQAMIDAGVWDDPAARQRMLKAYRDFDKNNAAR